MMENKPNLKKIIIISVILNIVLVSLFIFTNRLEYKEYTKNYNDRISSISNNIRDKVPSLTDNDILKMILDDNDGSYLRQYGYDIETDAVISNNNISYNKYILIELVIFILDIGIMVFLYLSHNRKKDSEIREIVKLVDSINRRNYNLDIETLSEEELSILRDQIYKITIMLREEADNSNKDKTNLKISLEDISHQLRTPLTSILINIDNVIDNPNLDANKRNEFLRKIKRESYNIKKLVESILKLSQFDINTIKFNRKKISINDLIKNVMANTSTLADLKNINIEVNGSDYELFCDYNWETEAITNILKNAVEHSDPDSIININYNDNKVYSKLEISNIGETISNTDLNHIFERFYKGSNSNSDSFGIGLALSKAIIERDNGKISVSSTNKKTVFTIKYYK